ncbi:gliding motility protein [Flavobacterium sp. CAU 1735]|uniref:type IX secretion system periplasmic lipoprotein PorW/SprE n=1 Tax=Flavobacterium sp. CAU 1735 TaxID=3140361 RepID=UPI003260E654
MKTNLFKYALSVGLVLFLLACSTKKNSFVRRNYHAVTAEYNILYNGGVAFDKGVEELKGTYKDNFWEILPVERMQDIDAGTLPGQTKNANFERAETKAIKAIQKHSMYIEGGEKNPQMDEAHLLLGKARYYDNRFIPALEAFNYILYKYSNSDKIYEAKVWREKTNIRLENEVLAIKNLKKLLEDQKIKGQVQADANAILGQAYVNLGSIDSALVNLKLAKDLTKHNEEKARYHFIIGQLYESMNYPDSAYASFQSVIDMNRKSPRRYVIQAHAKQAQQFDYKKGDTLAFLKKFNKLAEDRENRPFLDVINHQVALFYDKQGNKRQAKKYYNKSLRSMSQDNYLVASNYRNLAEINFDDAKYLTAGQYYDSTMSKLNPKTREFIAIKKKRENLNDVIKYEGIARVNDSILYVSGLGPNEQRNYYEEYIAKLKIEEAKKALEAEKLKTMAENSGFSDPGAPAVGSNATTKSEMMQSRQAPPSEETTPKQSGAPTNAGSFTGGSTFYFYNQATVAFGRTEFKKKWGNRPLKDNWRWSTQTIIDKANENPDAVAAVDENPKTQAEDERFTPDYYIKQLPTDQKVLDSLAKDRNFAYFQLGTIYKEKFKEYKLAASRLEKLLVNKPEERLVLPAKYNLFKIYEIIDPAKAAIMKQQIIAEYPDSRYAQILLNNISEGTIAGSPEEVYNKLFKQFEKDELQDVLAQLDPVIENFNGEEMVPKFELLKASVIGRLKGLEEYKKALNFVALNYPNAEEGKQAEVLLKSDIPKMEKLELGKENPSSWKIVFQVPYPNANDAKTKALTEKLKKYITDRNSNRITLSNDVYTMDKSFVIVHGFSSKEAALSTISVLKDFKGYKVSENAFVISNDDYKVVQIKKNLDAYLATLK